MSRKKPKAARRPRVSLMDNTAVIAELRHFGLVIAIGLVK